MPQEVTPLPAPLPAPPVSTTASATNTPNAVSALFARTGAALWLLGSILTTLLLLRRSRRFQRATAVAMPPPSWLVDELHALLPRMGITHAPHLAIVDADISPLVFAARDGAHILIPAGALAELSAAQSRTLLAHELAHIRRRDHLVRFFETAMTVLWWWLPLLWLLRAGLREAEERCCDAWVAAVLPDCRQAYCHALLRVATKSSSLPAPALASPLRRLDRWKTRLEDIMCNTVPHRPSLTAQLTTLTAALLLLPLAFVRAQGKAPAPSLQAKLAILIEARFENAALDDWTRWLQQTTKVPFVIDDSARQFDARRTTLTDLRLPKLTATQVLDILGTITGLECRVTAEAVLVRAPQPKEPQCFLIGAVRNVGPTSLRGPHETLLDALFAAGWTPEANLSQVTLIRPAPAEPLVLVVDPGEMLRTGSTTENVMLRDGDVIFVPRRDRAAATDALPAVQLAVGSRLRFVLYDNVAAQAGCEQLDLLSNPQVVGRDGTMFLPYVGHVRVLGKTKDEVAALVTEHYREVFTLEVRLHALFL